MKTVLVSGASGIVGYGALRSFKLSDRDLRLIGTSIYPVSPALGFSDIFELAPPTSDPGYIDWLCGIVGKHGVQLIVPGIEADMYKWAEHVPEIEAAGAVPLLNTLDLINACRDKWDFYEILLQAGISCAIETSLEADYNALVARFGVPFIVKPRRGFGSKGVRRIDSEEAFDECRAEMGQTLLAQGLIGTDSEEYTVSAFCDGQGDFHASMAMRRRLSREGFTETAEVVAVEPFVVAMRDLCRLFKPVGPTNFQFRVSGDGVKLLEINPRVSSSTSIRSAFGYNECVMALEYYLYGQAPIQPRVLGGKAIRYTDDLVFYDDSVHF